MRAPQQPLEHQALKQCVQLMLQLIRIPGPPAPGDLNTEASAVLSLTFANPRNWCYANASLHGLLWTIAASSSGMPIPNRAMLRILQWILRKPQRVHLWHTRAWQRERPHQQHDAGEFIQFLGGVLTLETGFGLWQARSLAESVHATHAQVMDHGEMFPLLLQHTGLPASQQQQASASPISLQQMLISWRNQADRHAAVVLPPVLPVQINRFDTLGQKARFPVRFSEAVYVPFFERFVHSHNLAPISACSCNLPHRRPRTTGITGLRFFSVAS